MPKVSVIVPVYNGEKYIKHCIHSVMGQTLSDIEILVINDGSSDGTKQILEHLASEDQRIHVFHQKNQGVSAARNFGITLAKGKYLTFLDADDYLGPEYLKILVDTAERTGSELIICGLKKVDEAGNIQETLIPGKYVRFRKEEWVARISCVAAHLYDRILWDKYAVRFGLGVRGEDMPVSLFFSAVCDKICTVSSAEYYYVQHEKSAMHNFRGLKKYKLPYKPLEEAIKQTFEVGIVNSTEYFELFVLCILATFIQLARGADECEQKKLASYIKRVLNTYFVEYYKNPKARLFTKLDVPFKQKMAVWLLVKLVRMDILYPFLKLLCRLSHI